MNQMTNQESITPRWSRSEWVAACPGAHRLLPMPGEADARQGWPAAPSLPVPHDAVYARICATTSGAAYMRIDATHRYIAMAGSIQELTTVLFVPPADHAAAADQDG
jgi:hypothetical protein